MARLFQHFKTPIISLSLPEKFTFPFYYEPHPLSIIAAKELQEYLETQTDWEHNFGLEEGQEGLVIGKMFGVLVVQNQFGELGYLTAYSGKLAESNALPYFVPTVYDTLKEDGFYKKEEAILNQYNQKIKDIENDPSYLTAIANLVQTKSQAEKELSEYKASIKVAKKVRDRKRMNYENNVSLLEQEEIINALNKESQQENIMLKKMTLFWNHKINEATDTLNQFTSELERLKEERKQKSSTLQMQLFEEYSFLNAEGATKSLSQLFSGNPPAGAGECAAPKLLHYAFEHQLQPIALAEFWWGQSPKSEVRQHGQYYPACMGKCEPILNHMLVGLAVDENPFGINPAEGKELPIVYEDDYIVLVNKPAEFLSVPGKRVTDSVYTRMKEKYPEATGPLIVHRLDMSTSGLLLIAKSIDIHKQLQSQFIKRQIKKRYIALLDGNINEDKGSIDLPLRVDLMNRPNQLVCYDYGKAAYTEWEVIERKNSQTKVYFYPKTGRTHQLRVHAAHPEGLHAPIVGDDLYGTKANRLYLHAESITFQHPVSKEMMTIQVESEF